MKRGQGQWKYNTMFIMILFNCCGNGPTHANTVAAHYKILLFAVTVLKSGFKRP